MPHLSVFDNIGMGLDGLPSAAKKNRVDPLLKRVSLGGLENRKPSQLSAGQQQRVALTRALARESSVLLLDEPFSSVDQVTRRTLRRELLELKRDLHLRVLLVAHDPDEACMLGDEPCVLQGGRTLLRGSLEEVMQHPETSEVARLIDMRILFSLRPGA